MNQARLKPAELPVQAAAAPAAIELQHLRYFVALAEAGSFTHAAERMFIAQPTLSQQIRRLEQIVGAPLLHHHRLTAAAVLVWDGDLAPGRCSRSCSRPRAASTPQLAAIGLSAAAIGLARQVRHLLIPGPPQEGKP